MKIPMAIMLLFMGFVTQACADSRGGVWVYQPDGGSYRVESRAYQYDPRSPYPQYRQYPQTTTDTARPTRRAGGTSVTVNIVGIGMTVAGPASIVRSAGTTIDPSSTAGRR